MKYFTAIVALAVAASANVEVLWVPGPGFDPIVITEGEKITFFWRSFHSLLEMSSMSCNFATDTIRTVQAADSGKRVELELSAGVHFFACDVGNHCAAGQLVQVTVLPEEVTGDDPDISIPEADDPDSSVPEAEEPDSGSPDSGDSDGANGDGNSASGVTVSMLAASAGAVVALWL
eukprot:Clim_evm41s236 gene=Clim_evmTU41s236